MFTPENIQTEIIRRESEFRPRRSLSQLIIGRPLSTADLPRQRPIGKVVGLAVFASDALSSSAYAIDEILIVLIVAGTGALSVSLPIAFVIVGLLAMLTISYGQTIHTYPGGGGAYLVARDNLGMAAAQTAGAALLTDYILTVAVSISSGVAQITSAFPALYPWRVQIALSLIIFMAVVNLRGVKGSGSAFAISIYFFLGMVLLTIGAGLYKYFSGTLTQVTDVAEVAHAGEALQALTLFLILRAFAGGCTALTGAEAISNGITAFKQPRSRNAGITLVWMSVILGVNLLGLTFLAHQVGVMPSQFETGFSQIGRVIYGRESLLYFTLLGSTTLILIMAANTSANTSFADFPRLAALHAGDGFLPKQLTFRGSRLVFSNGILALAGVASLLVVMFRAETSALIPLYAIGVYLSFTLSQAGMAVRWWRCGYLKPGEKIEQPDSILNYEANWKTRMVVNGVGSLATAIVMLVFAITKFRDGAWVVILLIPILVTIFFSIRHHYKDLASSLSLDKFGVIPPHTIRHRVIMPISDVHQGTMDALHYARLLSDDVTVVYISIDPVETEKVQKKWVTWGESTRLIILDSPYRLFIEPLLGYLEDIINNRQPNETTTVVVPQFIPSKRWHNVLHMQTANVLRDELLNKHGVVVTNVPYHVHELHDTSAARDLLSKSCR